jgi:hypothetical protein
MNMEKQNPENFDDGLTQVKEQLFTKSELKAFGDNMFEQGKQEALKEFKTEGYRKRIFRFGYNQCKEDVEKEIIKRDLQDFMGHCYSIQDINNGIGKPLLKWLKELGDKK